MSDFFAIGVLLGVLIMVCHHFYSVVRNRYNFIRYCKITKQYPHNHRYTPKPNIHFCEICDQDYLFHVQWNATRGTDE
jgi:hypothetical protein